MLFADKKAWFYVNISLKQPIQWFLYTNPYRPTSIVSSSNSSYGTLWTMCAGAYPNLGACMSICAHTNLHFDVIITKWVIQQDAVQRDHINFPHSFTVLPVPASTSHPLACCSYTFFFYLYTALFACSSGFVTWILFKSSVHLYNECWVT